MRRRDLAALAAASLAASTAQAQTYPDKPIHIIVPFTPGSATDVMARAVAQRAVGSNSASRSWSTTGPAPAARSAPARSPRPRPTATRCWSIRRATPSIPRSTPTSPTTRPRTWWASACSPQQPNVLVVAPSKGWKTAGDLVKAAKAKPGKLTYASAGTGSATHMNAEKFKAARRHRRPARALQGHARGAERHHGRPRRLSSSRRWSRRSVDRASDKRVMALAVGSAKRSSVLPDVPTTEEAGYPGSAYNFWVGMLAPAGTPPAVIERLNNEVVAGPGLARGQGAAGRARRRCRADHAGRIRQADRARARSRMASWSRQPASRRSRRLMAEALLQTTVVGSYPQPDWLVNRDDAVARCVPRTRVKEIVARRPSRSCEQAQDDATLLAIRDMERAGIDIITDGEMRRESYSNRFATALEGIDIENPGEIVNRARPARRRCRAWSARSGARGRSRCATCSSCAPTPTSSPRSPCPAPSPWPSRRKNEFYKDDEEMVHGLRRRGERGGARPGQGRRRRDPARRAVAAQRSRGGQALRREGDQPRAARASPVPTVVHLCFGYAAVVPGQQADRLLLPAAARRHASPSRSRSRRRSPSSTSAC